MQDPSKDVLRGSFGGLCKAYEELAIRYLQNTSFTGFSWVSMGFRINYKIFF